MDSLMPILREKDERIVFLETKLKKSPNVKDSERDNSHLDRIQYLEQQKDHPSASVLKKLATQIFDAEVHIAEAALEKNVDRAARIWEYVSADSPSGEFEVGEVGKARINPATGEIEYDELGWAQGFYAAGFRPGDIAINTFSYHMVPFALEMVDNSLHRVGCITIPTGVGNTEQQVNILRNLKANAYCGTPSFLLNPSEPKKSKTAGVETKETPDTLTS